MDIRNVFLWFLFFGVVLAHAATIPSIVVTRQHHSHSASGGPEAFIDHHLIVESGAATLTQALQTESGVQFQNLTGDSSQVTMSLRGFGANASSNSLFMINGIPITNPDMAPPDLNIIPLQDIEYIEIFTGTESVLYGDQAVGGVINIETRESLQPTLGLRCETGSYHQYGCYAKGSHSYRDLNVDFTLSHQHTDNYRDHNDNDQNNGSLQFVYPYNTGKLKLDYHLGNEDTQFPGALTAAEVRQNRRQANNSIDFFKNWNDFLHARQIQSLAHDWLLTTDIARRTMDGHGVLYSPFTQNRSGYYVKPVMKKSFNESVFTSGVELEKDDYLLNSTFGTNHNNQDKFGLFGLLTVPLPSRLSATVGARGAEQLSTTRSTTTSNIINRALATTLGLNMDYNEDMQLYVRRAGSYRFPKADETASSGNGITGLRTQRGVAYETGVTYKENRMVTDFNLYQLNLRDEIAFDPTQTASEPFGSNRNLSPTMRRGFSLSSQYTLTPRAKVDGQYNFVDAHFQHGINAGNRIPLVAAHLLHAGFNYQLTEHWQLYAESIYTGNQYAANDDGNIAGLLGGYLQYNANLHYDYKTLSVSCRVNNIFNRAYYVYTVYQPSSNTESFYPAPERNFTLSLDYYFT